MSNREDGGSFPRAVERPLGLLGDMEEVIERIHANADHLSELIDGGFVGFEHKRLTSIGFLIKLLREDALKLYGLYTQAKKNPTR